jgi:predicted lipid-binding transport protein (Tim44 family)
VDFTFIGLDKSDIVEAELAGQIAQITMRFKSQLISVTKDSDGRVIDGDPTEVTEMTDIWTFARDVSSGDPNWKLVATEAT